jgi:hypothetical protein
MKVGNMSTPVPGPESIDVEAAEIIRRIKKFNDRPKNYDNLEKKMLREFKYQLGLGFMHADRHHHIKVEQGRKSTKHRDDCV